VRRSLKPSAANLALQLLWLQRDAPYGEGTIRHSRLVWRASVQPGALTGTYAIELRYRLGERPGIFVVAPALKRLDGRDPPHRFEDGSLCLNVYGEWRPDMSLAGTMVLWALEWLVHYEIWLATGEWRGGGAPHGPQPKLEAASQRTRR
jgi:hypothetical protein